MDSDFRFDPFQDEDDASFNTTEFDLIDTIQLADLGTDDPDYYETSATYDGQTGSLAGGQPEGSVKQEPDWPGSGDTDWQDSGNDRQDGADGDWQDGNDSWQDGENDWQDGAEGDWQYEEEENWQYEDVPAAEPAEKGPRGRKTGAGKTGAGRAATGVREDRDDLKGRSRAAAIIIIAVVLVIAILTAASLIIMRGRQAEAAEQKLIATVEEIRANVNDGQFDDAMQKVNTLIYTRRWPEGMQEKWDGIRTDMTDYVNSARESAESLAAETAAAEEEARAAAEEAAKPKIYDISYYTELCRESIPFDNVSVLSQDDIIYVTFWQNGYGDQALYSLENGGEARQSWNSMISDIRELNANIKEHMAENGFAEYNLVFALLNDLDTRLTLVEFTNGDITYDALSE